MHRMTATLLAAFTVVTTTAAKCGDGPSESALIGGEVIEDTALFQALDYAVTSEAYNRWLVAQAALDTAGIDASEQIDVHSVTDDDVDRVVRSLETQPRAKAAIEGADLSVRDFVLTTIALAQSWDAVNRPGTRVVGLRQENVELLRVREDSDPVMRARPSARFIRDHDDSHENRGRGKAKGKHKKDKKR